MLARACILIADGNSHNNAHWPLANISQGSAFEYLDKNADTDKRVAAYLLVLGLRLSEIHTETLSIVDWQSRCEEAEARCETADAKISELTREISALKARIVALEQPSPDVAAAAL